MKDKLKQTSWLEYLSSIVSERFGTLYVDGMRMESGTRAYHRWVKEGMTPDFFSADRWLCRYDILIQDYVNFCILNEIEVWDQGEPAWAREVVVEAVSESV